MLKALKFVQGAVARRDFVPEMKHFVIEGGTVRAYNGLITLCSPIDFHVDCMPKAEPLVRAIGNCNEVVTMGMTKAGKLRIQSGGFKAFIECIHGEVPHLNPEGDIIELQGDYLLNAIKVLSRFIGNDASRPWTNGILLRGQSAYATNNVCLVEYWLGVDIPFTINIPLKAVEEMLRIGQSPRFVQLTENSVTFHYDENMWLRSQLFETNWPDLSKILDVAADNIPVPPGLFDALAAVKPFVEPPNYVYLEGDTVSTSMEEGVGASYSVDGLNGKGIFRVEMLMLLDGVATSIDFDRYPNPLIFYGDRVRGAIIGIRP